MDNQQKQEPMMTIDSGLAQRVMDELGENVYLCYQCVKCTAGCPVSEFFDWQPNQIMRSVQLGQEDIALEAETPWLCASCQTCSTRCPQGLDITAIMEFLTREAIARGKKTPVKAVEIFNEAFMREVKLWGRAYEVGLMTEIMLRTRNFTDAIELAPKMVTRNKLAYFPSLVRPPKKVKPVPGAANAIAYYPGCSLHSTAEEFDRSTRAVCEALDLMLVEPEGWLCCGSSAAHRVDPEAAFRLPMENLSIIEQNGFDEVTMPCAACFNRHKAAQYEWRHHEDHRDVVADITYQDEVRVSTLMETVMDRVGVAGVAERVERPLEGLKVVAYYGCLLTRPPDVTEAKNPENPTEMDELLEALGAEVVDWSHKTSCCGASHSLSRTDIVLKLSGNLIDQARKVGADAIAVACPLCHTNLDARQTQMDREDDPMPVLYITQLMSVAFGLPEKAAAFNKNLIDPRPVLKEKGLLPA